MSTTGAHATPHAAPHAAPRPNFSFKNQFHLGGKLCVYKNAEMKDPISFYIFRLISNFSEEYTIYELS